MTAPAEGTPVFTAHLRGTQLGTVRLWASLSGLRRVDFASGPDLPRPGEVFSPDAPPAFLAAGVQALAEYLEGRRRAFHLPVDLTGTTDFQQRVYRRLQQVPWGELVTYGQVAADLGVSPATAARAVGQAVGSNPLPILVPCHRVVGADGRLTGFSGGLERKALLLALEGVDVDGATASSRARAEVLRLPL